jgi:hypothetical protein
MTSKSSNISLYSSDNLSEKALHIVSVDAKLSLTSPNVFELSAPTFSLAGQTVSANDVADLGQKLTDMVTLQAADSTTQAAGIAANLTALSTLDAREAANHSAQATLLGVETARASAAEAVNAAAITAEESRATAAEQANSAAIVAENNAMVAAVAAEQTRAQTAEQTNAAAIAALGVVDTTTLAQINQMLADYQAADNSLSSLVSALDARLTTVEQQLADLTA